MAQPVRIVGHKTDREDHEALQAQVDTLGNLHVREGAYQGLNKTYEDTAFLVADSPVTLDVYTDLSHYVQDGYIICDGAGDIQVDVTRDGLIYGDKWTMKSGEKVSLLRMDIKKIRLTAVSNSAYRVNVI
jgi:hypothetical protein